MHWNTDPNRPPSLQIKASLGTYAIVIGIFALAAIIGMWLA